MQSLAASDWSDIRAQCWFGAALLMFAISFILVRVNFGRHSSFTALIGSGMRVFAFLELSDSSYQDLETVGVAKGLLALEVIMMIALMASSRILGRTARSFLLCVMILLEIEFFIELMLVDTMSVFGFAEMLAAAMQAFARPTVVLATIIGGILWRKIYQGPRRSA